nr:hypothetical protein [Tanacetum cinerariifolium]
MMAGLLLNHEDGGTGGRVGRGGRGRIPRGSNDERVDELNGQGNDQRMGANKGVKGSNGNVEGTNGGVGGAPDFSTIIAQQSQNLLPTILAQGGVVVLTRWIEKMESVQDMSDCSIDQKVKYVASSFVGKALAWWNSKIRTLCQEVVASMSWNDFKLMMIEEFFPSYEMQKLETELRNHVMVGAGHAAYTNRFHELARLIHRMVAATEPKTMQKAMQISGALTDEAIRNGSIKNFEKKGNVREPSKDKNGRNDNKRTSIRNAFATTANLVGRENTGAWPKCTTCNSYHAPRGPCRTCFKCNRPSHFAKDCRVLPRNVNLVNVRNPAPARGSCYECGSTDHLKPACPRSNRAQGPGGNRLNKVVANSRVRVVKSKETKL